MQHSIASPARAQAQAATSTLRPTAATFVPAVSPFSRAVSAVIAQGEAGGPAPAPRMILRQATPSAAPHIGGPASAIGRAFLQPRRHDEPWVGGPASAIGRSVLQPATTDMPYVGGPASATGATTLQPAVADASYVEGPGSALGRTALNPSATNDQDVGGPASATSRTALHRRNAAFVGGPASAPRRPILQPSRPAVLSIVGVTGASATTALHQAVPAPLSPAAGPESEVGFDPIIYRNAPIPPPLYFADHSPPPYHVFTTLTTPTTPTPPTTPILCIPQPPPLVVPHDGSGATLAGGASGVAKLVTTTPTRPDAGARRAAGPEIFSDDSTPRSPRGTRLTASLIRRAGAEILAQLHARLLAITAETARLVDVPSSWLVSNAAAGPSARPSLPAGHVAQAQQRLVNVKWLLEPIEPFRRGICNNRHLRSVEGALRRLRHMTLDRYHVLELTYSGSLVPLSDAQHREIGRGMYKRLLAAPAIPLEAVMDPATGYSDTALTSWTLDECQAFVKLIHTTQGSVRQWCALSAHSDQSQLTDEEVDIGTELFLAVAFLGIGRRRWRWTANEALDALRLCVQGGRITCEAGARFVAEDKRLFKMWYDVYLRTQVQPPQSQHVN